MKKLITGAAGILALGVAQADNLDGVDRMVCAAAQVQICVENDSCYAASPADLSVPDFVVIDLKKKTISTTRASNKNRSTVFTTVGDQAGLIYLQGMEGGRAFSFVIDEETGRMTVAISRDGFAVSVFGACTDADI